MSEAATTEALPNSIMYWTPRRVMTVVNWITLFGALGLIGMSLWPGYAGGCVALLALPCIGLLGLGWLLTASRALPPPWGTRADVPVWTMPVAPVLVCTTFAMLLFYVPRRVAFMAHERAFERMLPAAPAAGSMTTTLGRRVGIYYIDEWATDERGGVYFRTGTGPDGIGPDTMSCGFAYQPNRSGSPFGASEYAVRRLFGHWYWFRASNDWF